MNHTNKPSYTEKPVSTQLNTKYTFSNAIKVIPASQDTNFEKIQSLKPNEKRLSI